MVNVPAARDIIQEVDGHLTTPEIRVWCHPHYVGRRGDDYCRVFPTYQEAQSFIKTSKEAEPIPVIAFKGWELNLSEIESAPKGEKR